MPRTNTKSRRIRKRKMREFCEENNLERKYPPKIPNSHLRKVDPRYIHTGLDILRVCGVEEHYWNYVVQQQYIESRYYYQEYYDKLQQHRTDYERRQHDKQNDSDSMNQFIDDDGQDNGDNNGPVIEELDDLLETPEFVERMENTVSNIADEVMEEFDNTFGDEEDE